MTNWEHPAMSDDVFDLARHPVHLGLGATAVRLAEFDGTPEWYARYGAATAADGAEGRLVSLHTFTEDWDTWEVHPRGQELVVCFEGSLTLHQKVGDEVRSVTLTAGQAIVNDVGVWHTADVPQRATALFITAGEGTENLPR